MAPEGLRLFLRAGVFIALTALLLVFLVPRDSAEFVVSVCSIGIGLALVGLVILVNRLRL
jgi:hypothetical protein